MGRVTKDHWHCQLKSTRNFLNGYLAILNQRFLWVNTSMQKKTVDVAIYLWKHLKWLRKVRIQLHSFQTHAWLLNFSLWYETCSWLLCCKTTDFIEEIPVKTRSVSKYSSTKRKWPISYIVSRFIYPRKANLRDGWKPPIRIVSRFVYPAGYLCTYIKVYLRTQSQWNDWVHARKHVKFVKVNTEMVSRIATRNLLESTDRLTDRMS